MHLSLKIVHPHVDASAGNFSPPCFPPPPEYPVSISADGVILSRYQDAKWDLTPMSRKATALYFRDRPSDPRRMMDETNGAMLRVLMSYWLWGPMAVTTTAEMVTRLGLLRPLFAFCFNNRITADRINRHPKLLSKLPDIFPISQSRNVIRLLHDVFEARHHLGFFLLTREQIVALSAQLPDHRKIQTPYIPPRIWSHVMHRTLSVIDEFLAISDEYSAHFSNILELTFAADGATIAQPIPSPAFAAFAQKWIPDGSSLKNSMSSIASLVGLCARIQFVSYSLMRIEEATSLPLNCLSITRDAVGETIYTLKGNSTKTLMDEDARWIVSSDCVRVLRAADIVARLRLACRSRVLGLKDPVAEDAPLFPRSYEPWQTSWGSHYWDIRVVKDPQELQRELDRFRKVLSPQEMIIDEADMSVCRHLNPMAPATRIAVGLTWRVAWHQFRRTGAVNMLSSGLVSDLSLQYQLKHTGLSMSRYYGRGHVLLGSTLNDGARGEYVRAMYEILAREFSSLQSNRFVSPYGEAHKSNVLNTVSEREHDELLRAAKAGKIKYRSHLLGGCASPVPCNLGGFENVAACSLPKPCEYLIYDAARVGRYRILLADVRRRLELANIDTPLHEALSGQVVALEQGIKYCEASGYAEES